MPDFTYHLKNGKTMTLSGDTQPTDEEVENAAGEKVSRFTMVDQSEKSNKKRKHLS